MPAVIAALVHGGPLAAAVVVVAGAAVVVEVGAAVVEVGALVVVVLAAWFDGELEQAASARAEPTSSPVTVNARACPVMRRMPSTSLVAPSYSTLGQDLWTATTLRSGILLGPHHEGQMKVLPVDDERASEAAVDALLSGKVIVVPTDTVYGLAAVPHDPGAVQRIFLAKGRPEQLHLPVLASSVDQVRELGIDFSSAASALADRWWPGPLTMVLGFRHGSSRPGWLVGRDEVAVRIPAHAFMLGVMERTGVLLVTSANEHGSSTPPSADEVANVLGPHVHLVIDGGTLDATPSTLVNLHGSGPGIIERPGSISTESILETLATAS
jgi:L-threonylcarbamoyladenylate synthase